MISVAEHKHAKAQRNGEGKTKKQSERQSEERLPLCGVALQSIVCAQKVSFFSELMAVKEEKGLCADWGVEKKQDLRKTRRKRRNQKISVGVVFTALLISV